VSLFLNSNSMTMQHEPSQVTSNGAKQREISQSFGTKPAPAEGSSRSRGFGKADELDEVIDHKALLKNAIARPTPFPKDRFSGDGIVICGGGLRYFTCAWVCIRMLRALGCKLPIQLWHLGAEEMDEKMRRFVEPYDVTAVDGQEIRKIFPVRILNGWELKPFSIIHCPFERVIFLDADVIPVVDPTFLLSCEEFQETGAIFWPDYGRLDESREIWEACGVEYRDEPEFETGQIVIDKNRCWNALQVTMHLNEHSDFYYHLIHGDKETFHMGFLCSGTPYSMPSQPIESLEATMCQHDFNGGRLFQHRNMAKWDLYGDNPRIDGFLHEEECLGFVTELLTKWDGYTEKVPRFFPRGKPPLELDGAAALIRRVHRYIRVGYDERALSFLANGKIGQGRRRCEAFWDIREEDGVLCLYISSADTVSCILRSENGVWSGEWLVHEQMPIILEPTEEETGETLENAEYDWAPVSTLKSLFSE